MVSRGLRMSCVQSTVVEPAEDILERYMVQGLSNSVVQVLSHPHREPTKFPFELRPQLLDRVVVRTVRRQGQDAGTCTPDRLRHVGRAVGLEVVEDHHVPGAEFRCQYLIDIGLERLRVGGTGEDQRRPHTIQTQRRDHCCRTPATRPGSHRARVGRLLGLNLRAARLFTVQVRRDRSGRVGIAWSRKDAVVESAQRCDGYYVLRSNVITEIRRSTRRGRSTRVRSLTRLSVPMIVGPHLQVLRHSVIRGRPFGDEAWTRETAERLGLESCLPVGDARGRWSRKIAPSPFPRPCASARLADRELRLDRRGTQRCRAIGVAGHLAHQPLNALIADALSQRAGAEDAGPLDLRGIIERRNAAKRLGHLTLSIGFVDHGACT